MKLAEAIFIVSVCSFIAYGVICLIFRDVFSFEILFRHWWFTMTGLLMGWFFWKRGK